MNYGGSASFHLRIYTYPGSSRFTFSRASSRENGFTGERRGDAFNRSIAKKSAASPQILQKWGAVCLVMRATFKGLSVLAALRQEAGSTCGGRNDGHSL